MQKDSEGINFKLYGLILLLVPVLFSIYAIALLYFSWPISELSINQSGVFGDSFGALTALFSGLAFAGMIITIHLQYKELKLQRLQRSEQNVEFKRSAEAQEKTAHLSALSTLLEEYKYVLEQNSESLSLSQSTKLEGSFLAIHNENKEIYKKRKFIINQLEQQLEITDSENKT